MLISFFHSTIWKNICAILLLCLAFFAQAEPDDSVEFNIHMLDAEDRDNVDLSRFATSNYIIPGMYYLDIRINGRDFPRQNINYVEVKPNYSIACIDPTLLKKLTVNEENQKFIEEISPDCFNISQLPGISIKNDGGILDIVMPRSLMKYEDADWTPPELWDPGVSGLLVDYTLTGTSTRPNQGNNNNSLTGYGQAGINLGEWRLRAEYQGNYSSEYSSNNSFDWNQIYAYKPLPNLAAKLTLGETYLNSQVFDSFRFTGANIQSDERMLPPSLQGYAPEIHGIANTNAKVTVTQNGRLIYETTVPAGPFAIKHLQDTVQGQLNVRVEEQNGKVSEFQVQTANLPYMTRPGSVRYNTSMGQSSLNNHKMQGPVFYQGDFSWGMNNTWSLYGGVLLTAKDYNAWSLGLGHDMGRLGTLSGDITQSYSKTYDNENINGMSFKLNYAKTFDEYHSTITFAGYRFSEKTFRSFSQYMDERYNDINNNGYEKEMYTITGNKTFWADDIEKSTTLYLSYRHQNYWDKKTQEQYGVTVSRNFSIMGIEQINTNLSAFRTQHKGNTDDSISFNISVPLGSGKSIGYSLQDSNGKVNQMASYSDNSNYNNLWRVRAGLSSDNKANTDGYYQHRSQYAEINANASYQQDNYVALGATVKGGFTATRHGAALHSSSMTSSTARMMVDTDGVAGVPFNNQSTTTNLFGIGVLTDLTSYNNVDARIDVDKMDSDIETHKAITSATLTEGAIGYYKFPVRQGERLMAILQTVDQKHPPFGAEITNKNGENMGMVMEDGLVYIAGVNLNESLNVIWGGKSQCTITIPAAINDPLKHELLLCQGF
ncbi:fimbria/pilus outer membrane usher protein [Proteus genomosp. 6]|uniref:fimbria/pilus outer membrane usher protein n=1 Tax=Proteus genomosp. 6 TaxID=1311820 RepID=UPI000D6876FF|nr:fimbria/pilus outer membrane usher protein [Proteus genomosp. 6]MBG2800910.1 fimbria/pilus outer membrane usher protein [Proteus mirabilis]MBG3019784.1 fimbria/pilus outer membrane usher protein [Proteus mirabilis]MBG3151432.1 fimbria/pilus outer membrane usher protein [Proteus mirabilis]